MVIRVTEFETARKLHNRYLQPDTALIYNKDGEILADPGIRQVRSGVVFKYVLELAGMRQYSCNYADGALTE